LDDGFSGFFELREAGPGGASGRLRAAPARAGRMAQAPRLTIFATRVRSSRGLELAPGFVENTTMNETLHHEPAQSAVSLSPTAVERVKALLVREGRPGTAGLRLSVVGGGCSGFQYSLGFDDQPGSDDAVLEFDGVRVFVDSVSAEYLKGTVVDWVDGLHGAGFKFVNPNADRTCGCGSSFSV
jgi:iron-sulfur cluster assembly accessory protein